MEENYRGYKIRCEAGPGRENDHFKPVVQINWTINGHERVMLWCFARRLATHKDTLKGKALRSARTGLMTTVALTAKSLRPL